MALTGNRPGKHVDSIAQADSHEILFIFDENGRTVSKAMLYAEFEAILDGVVGLTDLAGRDCRAAYVQVNANLDPTAIVFFRVGFEADGYADPNWNVPLRHLASVASVGPAIGTVPVRVATRSDCPISWHRDDLWDADASPDGPAVRTMLEALRSGRLGILPAAGDGEGDEAGEEAGAEPAGAAAEAASASAPQPGRIAELIRQQRERISRLERQHEAELEDINGAHRDQVAHYLAEIQQLREQLAQQTDRFLKLQERANARSRQLRELQGRLERRVAGEDSETDVVSLRHHYQDRFQNEAREQVSEFEERLHARESELAYQGEIEEQLREEIRHLREERNKLVSGTADALLVRLQKLGVVFIAYHPGIGHLPIPLDDIPDYMDDPQSYAAAKCNVEPVIYRQWLRHWENPRCGGYLPGGRLCQAPVERVDQPKKYVHGHSNLCASCRHQPRGAAGLFSAGGEQ